MHKGHLPVVIIGGGLAGISAALHLKRQYILIEKDDRLGGLARTETRGEYKFDHTGHWLHLRDDGIKQLIRRLVSPPLQTVERKARIFSHDILTPYPFQANLHGLPPKVVHECLMGAIEAEVERGHRKAPRNFDDYIHHCFGSGIAKHFMTPYNEKLWGVHPREITSSWCQRFVPRPNIEEIVAGALGTSDAQLGYNTHFHYPDHGGIETVTRSLTTEIDPGAIRLGTQAHCIDVENKWIKEGEKQHEYSAIITTMPLPQLVNLIKTPPKDVTTAASKLRCTSVTYFNVGTRRKPPVDYHWAYVPEAKYPFYRVGIFSNVAPSMAPQNGGSYYVELNNTLGQPKATSKEVIDGLVAIGAIEKPEDVVFADERCIDPAYVIFDEHYESSVETIVGYLEKHHIYPRGRYGSWIYNAMEDSLMAGRDIAEKINNDGEA